MNMWALLAGLFAGAVGSMGLGGGTVLIIYLVSFASVEQLKAQGINLIFFVPIAIFAVILYAKNKNIKWHLALPMAAGGAVGAAIGLMLTDVLGGSLTAKLFGGLLILLGTKEIFIKKKKNT